MRPLIEQAIRRAAANAAVPDALKPYLSQATVDLFGAGTAANPAHFLVRLGRGARPFLPTTTITMAGAGAIAARLGAAVASVEPQQRTLAGGRDGQVLNVAGAFLVPPAMFKAVAASQGIFAPEDVVLRILCHQCGDVCVTPAQFTWRRNLLSVVARVASRLPAGVTLIRCRLG